MDSNSIRESFHRKIDISATRLKPYSGFIFLCGGPTDVRSSLPVSIRDAIFRELVKDASLEKRIRVAEHYKDWAHDSVYRDLVSFEKHLAELSSVIVLVLESAGSIAELGLFSAIEEFQKKLLVFMETDHYQSSSFIRLGPINYLEKSYDNNAECHRWRGAGPLKDFDPTVAAALQPELADAVRLRASKPNGERALNVSGWLDSALLTCDLLGYFSALTLRELRQLLHSLGVNRSEGDLKQILFLLEKVRLISTEPRGDQRFYIGSSEKEYLRFSFLEDRFDAMRFRSDLLAIYEKDEKKRFRAIQDVRARNV